MSKIIAVKVAKPGPGKNYCCEMMAEPGSGGKTNTKPGPGETYCSERMAKPGPGEEARAMMRR